jgi:uncharacterized protein YecE (DUF72 family)
MAQAWIGCSGWNYKHWRELFYPRGVGTAKWLAFYSARFNTVEVNSSFYRIPRAGVVEKWVEQTPAGFRFAVKLWRGISHYRKLINSAQFLENFFEVVNPLPAARRAPLLIQLPPGQGLDLAKLESFWRDLMACGGKGWRIAVEFRHPSWLTDEVYRFLDKKRAAICLHDMHGRGYTDRANAADFVYMRRHGAGEGRYSGDYSGRQIADDARLVRGWLREGRDVYVYYNNDIGGHAITNARQLAEAVGPEWAAPTGG